jgi:Tol biopolymer transport system component
VKSTSRVLHRAPLASVIVAFVSAAATAQTFRESVAVDGTEANKMSQVSAAGGDGRYVVFESDASNLVPDDHNNSTDIFVRDRTTGAVVRVSVASDGSEANQRSYSPCISSDGRFVAFTSYADMLVPNDTNRLVDVFRHDLTTGETIRVSVASDGAQASGGDPSISADGRYVCFASDATNLVPHDTNDKADVFRHDCETGETIRVSLRFNGIQAGGNSGSPRCSADGQVVAFFSEAPNLDGSGVNAYSVYVRDLVNVTTELVSIGDDGSLPNHGSYLGSISGDGGFVVFYSQADNLVVADDNDDWDVFLRDRAEGHTVLLSRGLDGTAGNGASTKCAISADGRTAVFESLAPDLVDSDTNGDSDVFVSDLYYGTLIRASERTGHVEAHGDSHFPSVAGDGTEVYFQSASDDLVDGDANQVADLFSFHRTTNAASWSNYGDGWPGKLGVPSIALDDVPRLDSQVRMVIGTSTDLWTFGFVAFGIAPASLPTSLGGTLLVAPLQIIPLAAPPTGSILYLDLPLDYRIGGVPFYFQWLEADAGASKGASFSAGLEMIPGS